MFPKTQHNAHAIAVGTRGETILEDENEDKNTMTIVLSGSEAEVRDESVGTAKMEGTMTVGESEVAVQIAIVTAAERGVGIVIVGTIGTVDAR